MHQSPLPVWFAIPFVFFMTGCGLEGRVTKDAAEGSNRITLAKTKKKKQKVQEKAPTERSETRNVCHTISYPWTTHEDKQYCTVCGDGKIDTIVYQDPASKDPLDLLRLSEECDDKNTSDGDGCSAYCRYETGYRCQPGKPCVKAVCGDGVEDRFLGETCDDGDTQSNDGCSSTCALESLKQCRQGIDIICTNQPICGDGMRLPEQSFFTINLPPLAAPQAHAQPYRWPCDDGNRASGDGCSGNCTIEPGFHCDHARFRDSISICIKECRGIPGLKMVNNKCVPS